MARGCAEAGDLAPAPERDARAWQPRTQGPRSPQSALSARAKAGRRLSFRSAASFLLFGPSLLPRSYFLRNAEIEGPAWPELRGEHTDTGAVPDLIDLVEHVHDIEAQRGRLVWRHDVEIVRHAHIDLVVGRQVIGVGKARTKSAAIDHRGGKARVVPQIRSPGRCGQDLAVIGVDVMGGNIGQLVCSEQELVRDDIGADLPRPGDVAVEPQI